MILPVNRKARRYVLRVLLGAAALGALVYVAADQFEIPREEIQGLFLGTLATVGVVIFAAALCAALWIGLRKLLSSRRDRT